MASPRAAFCALFGVSAAFLGCTATLDFAGLSAGRDGADAGRVPADASAVTGSRDAGLAGQTRDAAVRAQQDAGAVPDAGSTLPRDAGGGSSDGASVPDAQAADAAALDPASFDCLKVVPPWTFCDDFEPSVLLQPKWDETFAAPMPGGSIARDTVTARSGVGSMLATLTPDFTNADGFNEVWATKAFRGFQGLAARYFVEFDLRVEQVDPLSKLRLKLFQFLLGTRSDGYSVLSLVLESAGGKPRVRFMEENFVVDDPATSEVELSPYPPDHAYIAAFNINEWSHVTFVLEANEPGGTNNRASLTVGKTLLSDGPLFFALHQYEPTIDLGFPFVFRTLTQDPPSTAWQARYDNVLVRVELR